MSQNRPKFRVALIAPNTTTLQTLLEKGLSVPGTTEREVTVYFKTVGKPFQPQKGSGFEAVRVKSDFGGFTTLFYEPEDGFVSGLVCVRK